MASVPSTDRRRSPRRWAAVPVAIHYHGKRIDGVTINLSDDGMFLFAVAHLQPGDSIELEFHPPGTRQSVCLSGIIRRRALYLYGIEFLAACGGMNKMQIPHFVSDDQQQHGN